MKVIPIRENTHFRRDNALRYRAMPCHACCVMLCYVPRPVLRTGHEHNWKPEKGGISRCHSCDEFDSSSRGRSVYVYKDVEQKGWTGFWWTCNACRRASQLAFVVEGARIR